ncbi:glycosyltransferase family 87 protein [Arthrobacter sp. PAMC 25486]|uniref:glycosyltransferase family 87 protein n=1 Tax=Arthrobacter sp. PAMC 25486 TaxID=1494608 RepID=UPI0005714718|nr:glycosyltransferase family 87 protein [Arthrobacter sp. PAMC 25486]
MSTESFFAALTRARNKVLSARLQTWLKTPRGMWTVFAAVHAVFLLLAGILSLFGQAFSDTEIYRVWASVGFDGDRVLGPSPWVYPILALIPMAIAHLFGEAPFLFIWVLMIAALNTLAVGKLTNWGRKTEAIPAALWWIGFTTLLAWLGFARVDGITAPVVLIALSFGVGRPFLSSAILSIATWTKVWPAAVVLALFTVVKQRVQVVLAGMLVTAAVVALALGVGAVPKLLNFLLEQGDRGMQLEATFTTPWLWMSVLGIDGSQMYMNHDINSMQVDGPGSALMSVLMQPLLIGAALLVAGLIFWALHTGKGNGGADRTALLLFGSLALTTAFVVFNKVGSPQFMVWLAPAVAVGLSYQWKAWRVPATMLIGVGILTFFIYPLFYDALSHNNPLMALVLTMRNGLLVVLFIWSIRQLVLMGRNPSLIPRHSPAMLDDEEPSSAV